MKLAQMPHSITLFPPSILFPPFHSSSCSCPSSITTYSLQNFHSFPSSIIRCHASSSNSHNFVNSTNFNQQEDDYEEEEQVIGDCLVFEDGIFDDPFLERPTPQISSTTQQKNPRLKETIEPQNLIPEQWTGVVEELNLTKKERRKIAQELEFGQKVVKRKLNTVNFEEYLRLKNEKLLQLKPVVLDNPPKFQSKDKKFDDNDDKRSEKNDENSRIEPKNPRWAVYGRGLDDITEFFNSGKYQPTEKSGGRQALFTKEEKTLMNAKYPKLAAASSQKWLPLHTLAASAEFYLMNTLLQYDVDVNAFDQDGLTALHKAITSKKQAVINYLLSISADPFVCDKDGATLMHYAVQTAASQTIKTLLLHNVDINLQDNDGWTPLHLAVQSRRTDVVRLLLMKGADKTLKNKDGLTPLELSLYSGRDAKTYELIKLLKQLPRQHN